MRAPEMAMSHAEAVVFLNEVDVWLARTGTPWDYLCAKAKVHSSVRSSVRTVGNGMLRKSQRALIEAMAACPDGVSPEAIGRARYMLDEKAARLFAQELRGWFERTGTAPWRVATVLGRTTGWLVNWLSDPRPISSRMVQRYRDLMAEHPDGMGRAAQGRGLALSDEAPPPPPTLDPLEGRRGEAERQRKAWIAQQAAEHERKYGRPLGRPIEEMAA